MYERKTFITGNWKLNPQSKDEAVELAKGIADAVTDDSPSDVALFVPFPYIESVAEAVGDKVIIGAEVGHDCTDVESCGGGFTLGSTLVPISCISLIIIHFYL